ncbi:MAG: carboxymuconolactone decarboxylase family protein [Rhizobiaceae bacterium]|nr:carboxymuconolactone decarboxylase family protein [Rhizobiaceae bacterium]
MTASKPRSERFERGLTTRREVLGAAYVDSSLEKADDFNWAMQELTTEWCWDGTWNRPGLDRRSRSILNLGMIAALNRPHELKLHIRGAINNGLTKDELKEIFLQIGTYCGVPAALDSFRIAKDVFKEMGID